MSPGILTVKRDSGLAGVCIAVDETSTPTAQFVLEDGSFQSIGWAVFHATFLVCGFDEQLAAYRHTSLERAHADLRAGVFVEALALAAARGRWLRKPSDY